MKLVDNYMPLVIVGAWNKAIFTPQWVSEFVFNKAEVQVQFPIDDFTRSSMRFSANGIAFNIFEQRLQFNALRQDGDTYESFPRELMATLRQVDSILQGHPDMKHIPGVDMSSGSLGQGISAAVGMAVAAKMDQRDSRVYAIVGDGESEEGQVWEALMFAARHKLDNLCVIIDYNGLQIDGRVADIVNPAPFESKMAAFGLHVITVNAHDFDELERAFAEAKTVKGQPTAIIANSVKGKGVSFMEDLAKWHGSAPNDEQYEKAVAEIQARLNTLG